MRTHTVTTARSGYRATARTTTIAIAVTVLLGACGRASTAPPSSTTSPLPSAQSLTPSASAEPSGGVGLPIGRIIFDRYRDGPEGRYLDTLVLDAAGETKLDIPVEAVERRAVWSPDGARLLVNAWTFETGNALGVFDIASGAYTPVADGLKGEVNCSDWHPDGAAVICSLSGESPADDGIYTMNLTDGTVTRLTHAEFHFVEGTEGACGGGDSRAVYAPDRTRFAYQQQKCGAGADPSADEEGNIVVVDADGSNPRTVVDLGGVLTHPGGEISWSPTGDLIAFGTPDGQLSVVRADGTGLRAINLPVPGFVFGPAWSPDGNWILASVDAGSGADLYAVAFDGPDIIHITDAPEFEIYTDWTGDAP